MSVATSSRERRPDRRRNQLATAATARRWAEPWTPAEDARLLTMPGTVADRAKSLGRTYYATTNRLARLRKEGTK